MSGPAANPRQRNGAGTRLALVAAARRHFARTNYEFVGVREIASDAGVDTGLISRYFGGKEGLYRAVLNSDGARGLFDGIETRGLASHLASLTLDLVRPGSDDSQTSDILIVLRAASSPVAAAMVHDAIEQIIVAPIATRLGTLDGRQRAQLALSIPIGMGIVSRATTLAPCSDDEDTALRHRLLKMFSAALYPAAETIDYRGRVSLAHPF